MRLAHRVVHDLLPKVTFATKKPIELFTTLPDSSLQWGFVSFAPTTKIPQRFSPTSRPNKNCRFPRSSIAIGSMPAPIRYIRAYNIFAHIQHRGYNYLWKIIPP